MKTTKNKFLDVNGLKKILEAKTDDDMKVIKKAYKFEAPCIFTLNDEAQKFLEKTLNDLKTEFLSACDSEKEALKNKIKAILECVAILKNPAKDIIKFFKEHEDNINWNTVGAFLDFESYPELLDMAQTKMPIAVLISNKYCKSAKKDSKAFTTYKAVDNYIAKKTDENPLSIIGIMLQPIAVVKDIK